MSSIRLTIGTHISCAFRLTGQEADDEEAKHDTLRRVVRELGLFKKTKGNDKRTINCQRGFIGLAGM